MRLVIDLNMPSFTLQFFNRIGPFYLDLINLLPVVSIIFLNIAAVHYTRVYLEVDESTISHISNT